MLIKTLLNRVERFKSFIYDTVQIVTVAGNEALIIVFTGSRLEQILFYRDIIFNILHYLICYADRIFNDFKKKAMMNVAGLVGVDDKSFMEIDEWRTGLLKRLYRL